MKKTWTIIILSIVVVGLAGFMTWLLFFDKPKMADDMKQMQEKLTAMQELAEVEKQEMENDYALLDRQYGEMMTQITNDSLIAQITREQLRVRQLEEELRKTQTDNAAEIARLRRELNSVRAVLRSYIRQVDSLNLVNQSLRAENTQLTGQLEESARQNQSLEEERQELTERVNIAAQLDATNIIMTPLNKREKIAKKMKDCKTVQIDFTITRNVTAQNGLRTLYVRIQKPNGEPLTSGTFFYENRQLEYTMAKIIEYNGEETPVVTYCKVNEFMEAGEYRVSIFAEGNMIGTKTFNFK